LAFYGKTALQAVFLSVSAERFEKLSGSVSADYDGGKNITASNGFCGFI
jgi:hypothetical protein